MAFNIQVIFRYLNIIVKNLTNITVAEILPVPANPIIDMKSNRDNTRLYLSTSPTISGQQLGVIERIDNGNCPGERYYN